MRIAGFSSLRLIARGASGFAMTVALLHAGHAVAQTVVQTEQTPAEQAGESDAEVVVTGSRIERAGFDQPTPTTVIGAVELRQGQRPNLSQVLND